MKPKLDIVGSSSDLFPKIPRRPNRTILKNNPNLFLYLVIKLIKVC